MIKDLPSTIPYGEQGIFVAGTVNWLAYYGPCAIVSLDLI